MSGCKIFCNRQYINNEILIFRLLKKNCLACNQNNCLTYFREEDKILYCNECDAIFIENEEPSTKIFHHKDHRDSTLFQRIIMNIRGYNLKYNSETYTKYLKLKTNMNFKNALDIGTQYGHLVKYFIKIGIDAYGIESDEHMVKLSNSKKIKWAYFDENFQTNFKYDLICLTQMLYYQRDSYAVLEKVKKMLSPDGLIFIATTNPKSPILKNKLKTILPTYGANMILSKKNFESLEKKIGLKMLDYTEYRSNLGIDYSIGKNRLLVFLKYFLKIEKTLTLNSEGNVALVLLKSTK
jgi:2-polyprenyl-3-methyl-5-hydroxy-6-metoxy-1,4-benzoquinol methylase